MTLRLGPGLALMACCLLACSPRGGTKVTADPAKARPESAPTAITGPELEPEPVERASIKVSVRELDDMIEAIERVVDSWDPPEPGQPRFDLLVVLEDMALQSGLGPGALGALDLHGLHTFEIDAPHERHGHLPPDTLDLRATLATHDPARIVASLPAELELEELGAGSWRLGNDEAELLLQARDGVLAAGTGPAQLDAALAYRSAQAQLADPLRIYAEIINPDPEDLDLEEVLAELLDGEMIDLREASLDLSLDFGTTRDLRARFSAHAPFGDQRFDAPPITGPTALAQRLPPDPLFVMQAALPDLEASFGAEVEAALDQLDLSPALRELLDPASLFANLGGEYIVTGYFDGKGRATLVFAVLVDDEAAARTQLRKWQQAAVDELVAKGAKASFKPDGLALGRAKADLVSIESTEQAAKDFAKRNRWLFRDGKAKLELSALVADGAVIVAVGAGQRELMRAVSKRTAKPGGAQGLGSGPGLALARSLTEGCQTCMSFDLPAGLDAFLTAVEDNPEARPETLRAAKQAHASLRAMKLDGELAIAGRFEPEQWTFGVGVSASLLFADGAALLELVEQFERFVDELAGEAPPSDDEVCAHVRDVVERGMGSDAAAGLDIDECLARIAMKRAGGAADLDAGLECIMAADDLDELASCS